jgi:hypothetical protein
MAFSENDLLLSPDKLAQLTKALAPTGVPDPVQYFCDEGSGLVARMTNGYIIDPMSMRDMIRAVALFKCYSKAGPVPKDIQKDYDDTMKELQAIAGGERPNLPKVVDPASQPITGGWGSGCKVHGNIPGEI